MWGLQGFWLRVSGLRARVLPLILNAADPYANHIPEKYTFIMGTPDRPPFEFLSPQLSPLLQEEAYYRGGTYLFALAMGCI